jgi:hypothetical protein
LRPLAPSTYLLRNAGKTIPLTAVILLAVTLVAGIISMIDSIPYSIRTMYRYSRTMLAISPRGELDATPAIADRLRNESPVPLDRIVICRASGAQVRSIVGKWPFVVFGLEREDMEYILEKYRTRSLTGRLPEHGQPEAIVSRPVARNLRLSIGSVLIGPETQEAFSLLQKRRGNKTGWTAGRSRRSKVRDLRSSPTTSSMSRPTRCSKLCL